VSVRRTRPIADHRRPVRSGLSVPPRHQFVQTVDLVVGDAVEDIGQPCLRINAIQLGGINQGKDNGNGSVTTY